MNKLIFLGTGTSNGVPVIGCTCDTCLSKNPKDSRLRSSSYIITENQEHILIDIGPDFRQQALTNNILKIDGILITHSHQDHIGGMDEARQYNFMLKKKMDIYGNELALEEIQKRFDYFFKKTQEGGGKPQVELHQIKGKFKILGQEIIPIPIIHGELPILGYRIGDLTYITDASFISEESMDLIQGSKVLILNALRFQPHSTHFNLEQALAVVEKIKPVQSYFIHLTHLFLHERDSQALPKNVHFAYDSLSIEF